MLRRVILEQEDGSLLKDYLTDKLKLSQRLVKKVKSEEGKLFVNGEHRTVRYRLKAEDVLEIGFPPEKGSSQLAPEKMDLAILHEDEHLLVIDKEAGIPTIPSRLHPQGTLANGILFYYETKQIPYTIHVVTRLDKDTSGLVLIAKHQYSHSLLSKLQRANKIKRVYRAIVYGKMPERSGTIDAPIGRNPDSIIERMVREDGKRAVTHYETLMETEQYSEVKVKLETGRTHQIRVHFSHLGHPLVGDGLYGGKMGKLNRQALHCSEICFTHPFSGENIRIVSNLPKEMADLLR